jgi:threonine/homoserine/homoserine lactone efflux protein
MHLSTWIFFVAAAIVTVLSPGPAIFNAIANSVAFGWRRVAFSSLGNILGLLVISALTVVGLGALLKTSAHLFTCLKLVGSGYLIYLGVRQWRSRANAFTEGGAGHEQRSRRELFFRGLLIALTNPKAILFFTALFPQFLKGDLPLAPQFVILVATFMCCSFLALMSYGLLAHTARAWFADPRRAARFSQVTGSIFILLGLGLLRLKASRA